MADLLLDDLNLALGIARCLDQTVSLPLLQLHVLVFAPALELPRWLIVSSNFTVSLLIMSE